MRTNDSLEGTGRHKHGLRPIKRRLERNSQLGHRPPEGSDPTDFSVSVVIPSWNSMSGGKSIERAINSVVSQGLSKVEILVVDNMSTDETLEVCAHYGVALYLSRTTRSEARNLGLTISQGDYVVFLDSDHLLEPGALSAAIGLASRDNLDAVYFRTRFMAESPDGETYPAMLDAESRLRGGGIKIPNFYRRKSIADLKFPDQLVLGEDYAFYLDFLRRNPKIGSLNWGLRHFSPPGIRPVLERSYAYGAAFHRNRNLPEPLRFLTELSIFRMDVLRRLFKDLLTSPRQAIPLLGFIMMKYFAFAAGYASATRSQVDPARKSGQ